MVHLLVVLVLGQPAITGEQPPLPVVALVFSSLVVDGRVDVRVDGNIYTETSEGGRQEKSR